MTLKEFEIKVNQQYAELVRPLSVKEYAELKESIKEKGLHLPIIINQDNTILDGHHRYQICNELGIDPKYEVKIFEDLLEEKSFVIDINDKRRQLNDFAKSELAYKLEAIESEKARLRQIELAGTRTNNNHTLGPNEHKVQDQDKGKTREIVSKKVGISPTTYERAKTIIKYGTEEQKTKLREGKSKINKEYKKIQKDKIRNDYLARLEYLEAREKRTKNQDNKNNENNYGDRCSLINGDFMQVQLSTIKTPNILIFTDPPYADTPENLSRYEGLARFADRVLNDGDSIVFYVGHIVLNKVFRIFDKYPSLKYWWIFAVKHSGNHTKIYSRNVFSEWKPMLWYVKGKKPNNIIVSNTFGDFIKSIHQGKYVHEWEQSTVEAEYIIKHLTIENHSTVLDPMMGSGTTGLAALYLERKFIGIEIDKTEFEKAETRLKNYCWSVKNKQID